MTGRRSGGPGDGCGGQPGLAQPVAAPPRSALRHCLGRAAAWTPRPDDRRAAATIESQGKASARAPRCGGTSPDDTRADAPADQPPRTGEGPGGDRQRARVRQRSRCNPQRAMGGRVPQGLFHVEHRDALTTCAAQGRGPDGRRVSPPGKCMVRRPRGGHRRAFRPAPPPRAYATCDVSGVRGRAGRRSRLAKGTWEYHRAENTGAPRRRGHRSATGQRTSDATAAETPGQQRAGELVATSRVPPQHPAGAVQSARATGEARARRSSIGWNGGRGRSRTARASTYTAGTV
ncbi:hypothetical protein FHR89_001442 [Cellulomonas uda]|nr:hypothetical protein [Cellulomonas uda]